MNADKHSDIVHVCEEGVYGTKTDVEHRLYCKEVKPDNIQPVADFCMTGIKAADKMLSAFKRFKERAVASHRFDMQEFRQCMDREFKECGYRNYETGKQTEILVITDSGVGDFVSLSPSLREIRRIYIGAKITLVSYSRAKALTEVCPYIDELHLNSQQFALDDFLAAYDWNVSFSVRLLKHKFDVAFVFGHYPNSYLLAYMSGAKERISYGNENHICSGHPYAKNYPIMVHLLTVPLPYVVKTDNAVDMYLGILDNFLHAPVQYRRTEI